MLSTCFSEGVFLAGWGRGSASQVWPARDEGSRFYDSRYTWIVYLLLIRLFPLGRWLRGCGFQPRVSGQCTPSLIHGLSTQSSHSLHWNATRRAVFVSPRPRLALGVDTLPGCVPSVHSIWGDPQSVVRPWSVSARPLSTSIQSDTSDGETIHGLSGTFPSSSVPPSQVRRAAVVCVYSFRRGAYTCSFVQGSRMQRHMEVLIRPRDDDAVPPRKQLPFVPAAR